MGILTSASARGSTGSVSSAVFSSSSEVSSRGSGGASGCDR